MMLRARGQKLPIRLSSPTFRSSYNYANLTKERLGIVVFLLLVCIAAWSNSSAIPQLLNKVMRSSPKERGGVQEDSCACPPPENDQDDDDDDDDDVGAHGNVERIQPTILNNVEAQCDTLELCRDHCGFILGCGRRIYCQSCYFPETCGGGGVPNKCGCTPLSCEAQGRTCGEAPDGCGGVRTCGGPCPVWQFDPVSPRKPPPPAPQMPYRVGLMTNYAQYREGKAKMEPEDIHTEFFTHLMFSSAHIDNQTMEIKASQWNDDDINEDYYLKGMWRRFVDHCQKAGVAPIIQIGGDLYLQAEGGHTFSSMVANSGKRESFAKGVRKFLAKYKFEGLEIEWIPNSAQEFTGYMDLLRGVRQQMEELSRESGTRYWLAVRAPAPPEEADRSFPDKVKLSQLVDWITITTQRMHYYMSWEHDLTTHAHTPIQDHDYGRLTYEKVTGHWRRCGVSLKSLILQIPTQAAIWILKEASEDGYGDIAVASDGIFGGPFIPYYMLSDELATYHMSDMIHRQTSTAYAVRGTRWASYDNAETVAMKVDFIVQKGLGGYFMVAEDDPMHELVQAASDRTRPTHPKLQTRSGQVMQVTSGYVRTCDDPKGNELILRSYLNKLGYVQKHNHKFVYNQGDWLDGKKQQWTKVPLLQSLLRAYPEVEWFMWVDTDAFFTDMSFSIPLNTYKGFNLVVPGWRRCVYEDAEKQDNKPWWTCINSGIFLIRNCRWSLELLDQWAVFSALGKGEEYGKLFSSVQLGRPEGLLSNDQSGLLYLLQTEKDLFGDKTYFEEVYDLHGFWVNLTSRYEEWTENKQPPLEWPKDKDRPPFITHFVGCKVCGGLGLDYSKEDCFREMTRALNFADNQLYLKYNVTYANLNGTDLVAF